MTKQATSSIKTLRAKPLGEAIEELVQSLGIKKKLHEYEAVLQWEQIVGEQIAKVATATRITKGVLFVKVKTGTWRNELTIRKPEIMKKINTTIGEEIVHDIKFQ
ncbi:MAG: DUF721 domain-containing protein [Ignavibacteriales bacterium]|nr:DUF721 domain-containing protein [Ignavibacteriales bacterium]